MFILRNAKSIRVRFLFEPRARAEASWDGGGRNGGRQRGKKCRFLSRFEPIPFVRSRSAQPAPPTPPGYLAHCRLSRDDIFNDDARPHHPRCLESRDYKKTKSVPGINYRFIHFLNLFLLSFPSPLLPSPSPSLPRSRLCIFLPLAY